MKQIFLRNPIYWEGLVVVPILLLGNLFLGVYYNLSVWFKLSDKTGFGTLITAIGAIVAIVGNILLIPLLGYVGCALTFLLSCFVMTVICYALGNKYYPVPYDLRSALGYVGGAGLLIYLSSQIQFGNQFFATAFHLLLCGLFLLAIFLSERRPVSVISKP